MRESSEKMSTAFAVALAAAILAGLSGGPRPGAATAGEDGRAVKEKAEKEVNAWLDKPGLVN